MRALDEDLSTTFSAEQGKRSKARWRIACATFLLDWFAAKTEVQSSDIWSI